MRAAMSFRPRDQRMIVVSLDFFVTANSPAGETVVPLDVADELLVMTPFTLLVFSLLDCVETIGAGATGVIVVTVVLEVEDCANAPPVIRVTAIVAASKVLII